MSTISTNEKGTNIGSIIIEMSRNSFAVIRVADVIEGFTVL